MTCGRNAYALAVRLLASVNLKFSKLKCNLHFPTSRSKYWLDKDFAFVRIWYDTRYAEQAIKRYGVSQS